MFAKRWLKNQGLKAVVNNYLCPMGELDLIMLDPTAEKCVPFEHAGLTLTERLFGKKPFRTVLVIVEVKYRQSDYWGSAAEQVTLEKQRKVIQATNHFLASHPKFRQYNLRFDVLAISGDLDDANVDWHKNAFWAND